MKLLCESTCNDTDDSFMKLITCCDDNFFIGIHDRKGFLICIVLNFLALGIELIEMLKTLKLLVSGMKKDVKAVIRCHHTASCVKSWRDLKSDMKRIDRSLDIEVVQKVPDRFRNSFSRIHQIERCLHKEAIFADKWHTICNRCYPNNW